MPIVSREFLFEKQNYAEMVNDIKKIIYSNPVIPDATKEIQFEGLVRAVNSIAKQFKRHDVVVYLIRLLKIAHISNRVFWVPDHGFSSIDPEKRGVAICTLQDFPFIRQWLVADGLVNTSFMTDTMIRRFLTGVAYTNYEGQESTLAHFLSLPIPAIRNFRFGWQNLVTILDEFREAEEVWKNENRGKLKFDPQNESTFLEVGDSFEWVLLPREYCELEGNAMGHCGNGGSPNPGDRILSLRKREANGWHVYLTFILDKNGRLGEMKGRANNKPSEKYHKYIIPLLLDSRIKGIKGGGYAPENNFELSDLPDEKQEMIVRNRPEMVSLGDIITTFGIGSKIARDRMIAGFMSPEEDSQGRFEILETTPDKILYKVDGLNIFGGRIRELCTLEQAAKPILKMGADAPINGWPGAMLWRSDFRKIKSYLNIEFDYHTEIADQIWKVMNREDRASYKSVSNLYARFENHGRGEPQFSDHDGQSKIFEEVYYPALIKGYIKYLISEKENFSPNGIKPKLGQINDQISPDLLFDIPVNLELKFSNEADAISELKYHALVEYYKSDVQRVIEKASPDKLNMFYAKQFTNGIFSMGGAVVKLIPKSNKKIQVFTEWVVDNAGSGVDTVYLRNRLEFYLTNH